MRVTLSVLVKT